MVVTPPPSRSSLPLRGLPRLRENGGGVAVHEMERGVGERERWTLVVSHDKHRRVEERLVTPPAAPLVVAPRAALGSELVAAHDLGADVVAEVPDEAVVEAPASPGLGADGPTRRGAGPGEEPSRIDVVAERPLQALVLASGDASLEMVKFCTRSS
jgi:hypothetical protein